MTVMDRTVAMIPLPRWGHSQDWWMHTTEKKDCRGAHVTCAFKILSETLTERESVGHTI